MLIKPIMSADVEAAVLDCLSQFENKDKWVQWGMHNVRRQGTAILMQGPPGCGKTFIAEWMSKRMRKGFLQLNLANLQSDGSPGSMEKAVANFFADARRRKNSFVFMDECDGLLLSRTGDVESSWQVSTTETVMTEMAIYPGPIAAATNLASKLDDAVAQRFSQIITVGRPDYEMRKRIWAQKWPERFPLHGSPEVFAILAKHDLNGRQIENVLVNAASRAIRKKIKPSLQLFKEFALMEEGKHIDHAIQSN